MTVSFSAQAKTNNRRAFNMPADAGPFSPVAIDQSASSVTLGSNGGFIEAYTVDPEGWVIIRSWKGDDGSPGGPGGG